MYRFLELLFDKLTTFDIPWTDEHKRFNSMAFFNFESNCVGDKEIKDTENTTQIGKHTRITV